MIIDVAINENVLKHNPGSNIFKHLFLQGKLLIFD